jgi:hypothetical protein
MNGDSPIMNGNSPQSGGWLAETVRVTAFGPGLVPKSWKDAFGGEPDQIMRQPSTPTVEGGRKNGVRWLITHQGGRVDVVVTPENPVTPLPDLLHLGEFEAALDSLLVEAEKVFEPTANVYRLAVGAVLLRSVASISDGIEKLRQHLPYLRDIPNRSTEVFFQINVPDVIENPVPELVINRIAKWQVAGVQLVHILSGPVPQMTTATTAMRPVLRLEFDINSTADRTTALPTDQLGALMTKFGAIGKEIAASGEFQ